ARLCEGQALLLKHFGRRAEKSLQQAMEESSTAGRNNEQVLNAARLALAQFYALEDRADEARAQLMQTLGSAIDPAIILSVLLEVETVGPEPTGSLESLQKFTQNDATDLEARRALGHQYLMLGKLQEARELLEACLREQPQDMRAAESLSHCLNDLS